MELRRGGGWIMIVGHEILLAVMIFFCTHFIYRHSLLVVFGHACTIISVSPALRKPDIK